MIRVEQHGDVTRFEMIERCEPARRLLGERVSRARCPRRLRISLRRVRHMGAMLARERPRGVFITHYHEDHAGNVERVARLGIPIAASPETLAQVRSPAPIRLYRRFTWGSAPPLRSPVTPFESDALALVAAPGHSPRSSRRVGRRPTARCIGGDLYLGVKVRVAHPGEDPRVLVGTLRHIAALGPTRLFDAHRGLCAEPGAAADREGGLDRGDDRGDRAAHRGRCVGLQRSFASCSEESRCRDISPAATTRARISSEPFGGDDAVIAAGCEPLRAGSRRLRATAASCGCCIWPSRVGSATFPSVPLLPMHSAASQSVRPRPFSSPPARSYSLAQQVHQLAATIVQAAQRALGASRPARTTSAAAAPPSSRDSTPPRQADDPDRSCPSSPLRPASHRRGRPCRDARP